MFVVSPFAYSVQEEGISMSMDRRHGLPVLNHLLQHTLRSICSEFQWVYAVFWRILPRNYPPPKWDNETGFLDRSKGNKRNWILTWEDGFCDFAACAKSANGGDESNEALQPELFFKMSHEVYSYGEGLMGKVASDSSHKWIFKDPSEQDASLLSPWHGSLDPQPRTWESQFKAGIQTIAVVAVQEGLLQLGSLDKVFEDLNLVIMLQRKFTYLQSIPGVFAPHPNTVTHMRPRVPLNYPAYPMLEDAFIGFNYQRMSIASGIGRTPTTTTTATTLSAEDPLLSDNNQVVVGLKRTSSSTSSEGEDRTPTNSTCYNNNNGRNIPERPPLSKSQNTGHSPPGVVSLQPSMSSLHALLSKLPSVSAIETSTPAVATTARNLQQTNALSRSMSLSKPFNNFSISCIQQQQVLPETQDDLELALRGNMQLITCKSGATSSTKMSTMPDTTKGSATKDKLNLYLEAFENLSDFGIHSELDAYNSFLSEIIN